MRVLGSSSRSCDRRQLAHRIDLVGVGSHRIVVVVEELEMTFEGVPRNAVRSARSLDLMGGMTTMVVAMECTVVGEVVVVESIPVGEEVVERRFVEVVEEQSIAVEVQGMIEAWVEEHIEA